jgi:hypothetical protein
MKKVIELIKNDYEMYADALERIYGKRKWETTQKSENKDD